MEIYFERPVYLLILFIIPFLILIHFITLKTRKKYALLFSNFEAIKKIRGTEIYSKNITLLLLYILVISLISFSLAKTTVEVNTYTDISSYVIAIDSSKSMEATDFSPNRFVAAKNAAKEFIEFLPRETKVGIVSFSGVSLIEKMPTTDKTALKTAIENIELSQIGGTDLIEAVITSSNLLKDEKVKTLIILSDGQFNVGNIDEAIEYANKNKIKIHTIAIGTEQGGETSYGISTLEKKALQALSYETNGKFFFSEDNLKLSRIFSEIKQTKETKVQKNISDELLLVSIFLILLSFILLNTRYRGIP